MKYFDKYNNGISTNLPSHIDLGRFAIIDNGSVRDLTNEDVLKLGDYVVRESLFDETNQNIHELLRTISNKYDEDPLRVTPILQKFNVEIKSFEKALVANESHLKAIAVNPHSLLDKNTIKVNIGRAKRISTRSYQYLTHHSEDWEKLSVISPKPRKILHEELVIDFNVYENVLFKAFLRETIKYLNKRIKETADITKFFLSIFDQTEFLNTWGEKIDRSQALVGKACKNDQSRIAGDTNRLLMSLKSELVKLEHAQFLDDIPKRLTDKVVFHETNVLNDHKHYKFLKLLWINLMKLKGNNSEQVMPEVIHKTIMDDMRTYVKSLFIYTLTQSNYSISLNNGIISASHHSLPDFQIEEDKYGILNISTENTKIRVIVLGGIYDIDKTRNSLPEDAVCFCFYDYQKMVEVTDSVFFVNPIDTDSIECSGIVLRKQILLEYASIVNQKYPFMHLLRDFVDAVGDNRIVFDKTKFTYSFANDLPIDISDKQIMNNLQNMPDFKKRNNRDRECLLEKMSDLLNDVKCKCEYI